MIPSIRGHWNKVHFTQECHQQRRLPRASRSDDKVEAAPFEKQFAIHAQGKLASRRCKGTVVDVIIRPGEAGILEPNYAPIKV